MGSSKMPWKCQEMCIWTQCFTKNVIRYGLDQVMFHSSTMRESRYERHSPQLTSPVSTVTDLSPHFRFEKQIKTVQTWCFCTKKKNDWSWGLLMENLKYWLLIGRANLISTNGLSFTVCSQPFQKVEKNVRNWQPSDQADWKVERLWKEKLLSSNRLTTFLFRVVQFFNPLGC